MRCIMRFSDFSFDVKYNNGLLSTQAEALSCLCALRETAVPVAAEFTTYSLPAFPASNDLDVIEDVDKLHATTTDSASSFFLLLSMNYSWKRVAKILVKI